MENYRIKETSVCVFDETNTFINETTAYCVQVHGLFWWHDVKVFVDWDDTEHAKMLAEELLEKLNEKY